MEFRQCPQGLRESGIGKDRTIVKSVTTITTKQRATPQTEPAEGSADQAEGTKRGRFAARMMKKLKGKGDAERRNQQTGGDQTMTVSSELRSHKGGIEVALPTQCVEAHAKKMKKR